jgi:hypothetical protein
MPKQFLATFVVITVALLVVSVIDDESSSCYAFRSIHIPVHSPTIPYRRRLQTSRSSIGDDKVETPNSSPNRYSHYEEQRKYIHANLLQLIEQERTRVYEYTSTLDDYGPVEVAAYSLFDALRYFHLSDTYTQSLFGMKGHPFVLRRQELESILPSVANWSNYFTMDDLQQAVQDDFLDAVRGSTDQRKGWKVRIRQTTVIFAFSSDDIVF